MTNPPNRPHWEWYLEQGKAHSTEKIEIETTPVEINFQTPWSVFVCRASSPNLQNYFIGLPLEQDLNFRRLSEYAGRAIDHVEPSLHMLA
jgi:hypothetical protein